MDIIEEEPKKRFCKSCLNLLRLSAFTPRRNEKLNLNCDHCLAIKRRCIAKRKERLSREVSKKKETVLV